MASGTVYFRGSDPSLMFGVWIALDPATTENGCMELIPGSHRAGPVPHIPHPDINLCTIDPRYVHPEQRVAVPLGPGDTLVFSSLAHHYTAANRWVCAGARCSSTIIRLGWIGHRWRRIARCTMTMRGNMPGAPYRAASRSGRNRDFCRVRCVRWLWLKSAPLHGRRTASRMA